MTDHIETFRGKEIRVLPGAVHPAYSVSGFDEERDFRDKYWTVEPGEVVIDVGASYGFYTLTALAAGAARVYAFEPIANVCADLVKNVGLNGWLERCDIVPLGLYDAPGPKSIYDYAKHWPREVGANAFEAVRLDTWASVRLERLDWLKIDVEGAEENVIRGGLETIAKFRPRLIVECHTFIEPGIAIRVAEMLPAYQFEIVAREPCVMLVGSHK